MRTGNVAALIAGARAHGGLQAIGSNVLRDVVEQRRIRGWCSRSGNGLRAKSRMVEQGPRGEGARAQRGRQGWPGSRVRGGKSIVYFGEGGRSGSICRVGWLGSLVPGSGSCEPLVAGAWVRTCKGRDCFYGRLIRGGCAGFECAWVEIVGAKTGASGRGSASRVRAAGGRRRVGAAWRARVDRSKSLAPCHEPAVKSRAAETG